MAVLYGSYGTPRGATPVAVADGDAWGGRVRAYHEKIPLAAQATTDTIVIAQVPAGSIFLYGVLLTTVTLGASATIAIGITGTTGKYRTAAVFTTADTPTFFGNAAASSAKLTVGETIFITIGTAALPGSGTLFTSMFFAQS